MAIITRIAARSMPVLSGLSLRALSTSPILTGTVSWFDTKKGYGFIVPDDSEMPEVFVHQTAIQATGFRFLEDAEKVEFSVEKSQRGLQASNVTGPGGAPLDRAAGERPAPGGDEF